jgi:hypothetical protein
MKKSILACIALLLALFFQAQSQKLALEKTYQITGSAKRGYLDEVTYEGATQTTKLSFVTRETISLNGSKSKVKYEDYFFDKDFNFVKMDAKVDDYHNRKYRGDQYEVEGVSVQNNLIGTFVLRKKLITFTWDWFFGGYKRKVKLLEKLKPKDDSGNKYTLIKKFENDETGEVIAMVRAKGKGANGNEYIFLKIDKNLIFETTDKIAFDAPQAIAGAYIIPSIDANQDDDSGLEEDDEDDSAEESDDQGDLSTSDAGFIFAASVAGKKGNSDSHDYIFLRVNAVGKILERTAVKTKASVWNINQMVTTGKSTYIMGPANDGKYYDQAIVVPAFGPSTDLESMKWKLFQLCKITDGKADFVTTTDLDEFETKLKAPPSQKKSPSYRGKRFHFTAADVYNDGSILISGQNYEWSKRNKVRYKSYRDVVMFHFDNAGILKSQYGVRREENNKYAKLAPAGQRINNGKATIYWTVMEMDGIRAEREGKVKIIKALIYPSVARIDPATGNISDFVQFGLVDGKPHFYLHNNFPLLPMSDENSILYLGVDKPGKNLWFGKVILD